MLNFSGIPASDKLFGKSFLQLKLCALRNEPIISCFQQFAGQKKGAQIGTRACLARHCQGTPVRRNVFDIFAAVKRIPSLDGLRAISILLVLVGHWTSRHHELTFLSTYANLGVRVFFVISGYLITTLLLKEQERSGEIQLKRFYIQRAYRILPAAFAFAIPVMILYRHELSRWDAAAATLYLMNFDFAPPWCVGHLWSLSVEEQFYFLWPGVLRKWFRHRRAILVGVIAVAPVYSAVCYFLKVPGGGYGTFPAVADNLAVGCLAAILGTRIGAVRLSWAWLMMVVIVLVPQFAANTPTRTLIMLFVLWPAMHFSIAGILLHVVREPYRILNLGPVVFVGKISYSLYLWQQLFFFRPTPWPTYIALPAALGCACLSYWFIEQPMLRLRERERQDVTADKLCLSPAGD